MTKNEKDKSHTENGKGYAKNHLDLKDKINN